MLVNNAGVAHYMPFAELPADKASELVHAKVAAPAMLARAAVPGMIARGEGTIRTPRPGRPAVLTIPAPGRPGRPD